MAIICNPDIEEVAMKSRDVPHQYRSSLSEDGKTISLDRHMLTSFPAWLRDCRGLATLHLSFNQLTSLPEWIGELTNLTKIDLSFNQLTSIPECIGNLTSLSMLNLIDNQLTTIPDSIGNLANLTELNLVGNQITILPETIGNLAALTKLNLERNNLVALPSSTGHLSALTTICLYHNRLTGLPDSMASLTGITELILADNELTALPDWIGNLTALKKINLKGNKLAYLPNAIGNLPALSMLNLADNKLTKLPKQLGDLLARALVVYLENNPLDEPLPELVRHGSGALAVYLQSLDDSVEQYEARILLIGEAGAGKTSLVAALRNDPFLEERPATHGIEITSLTLPHPTLDCDMMLQIWDFGGNEDYWVTHQLFFSRGGLYVIVWRACDARRLAQIVEWLQRIRLRVGHKVRIILVATYCDNQPPELDYGQLKQEFGEILTGSLKVDNRTGTGIAQLRHAMAEQAALLPKMGQRISRRWIAARDQSLSRAQGKPLIQYEVFKAICANNGVGDREFFTFTQLMCDLGYVIHHGEDEILKDIVVLSPEWLTKAISYVLDDEPTRAADGVLDHTRLREILRQRNDGLSYSPQYYAYLLRLMERFDISYRLQDNELRSLVVQRVPYNRPLLPWDYRTKPPSGISSLALIYRLSEPLPGFIPWLTVCHHHASTGLHWRRGVFLRHPIDTYASEALLELRNSSELVMEVRAPWPDLYFNILRDSVEKLIMRRWPGLTYEIDIPCPGETADGSMCSGQFPLDGLLRLREAGHLTYACTKCARFPSWEISLLLTGFTESSNAVHDELDRQDSVFEPEGKKTVAAQNVRRILQTISTEVIDCPRLFSIVPDQASPTKPLSLSERHYLITLWCEHLGYWHPLSQANYRFYLPIASFVQVCPYLTLMLRTLRLVIPADGSAAEVLISAEQLAHAQSELQLMGALLTDLPAQTEQNRARFAGAAVGHLTVAEGQGLSAIRSLVFEHDPQGTFGGLRRVQAASGDFLWICAEHYLEYDRGLPANVLALGTYSLVKHRCSGTAHDP